jgi:hypothetical protein
MGLFGGGNSTQQTTNLSQTQTQDRRVVADGGSGVVNADNSTVTMYQTQSDQGAIQAGVDIGTQAIARAFGFASDSVAAGQSASLYGAQTSQYAVGTMGNAVTDLTKASSHLNDVGLSMLQANTALTNSLNSGADNLVTHALDVAAGLYRDAGSAQTQTTQIAADLAKTQVAAQNDNRYLIAVGLAVVCIVGVMAFKGHA